MRTILIAAGLAAALGAAVTAQPAAADSAQLQALEAAIREARAMNMDPGYIRQMEEMLAAARADAARRPGGAASGHADPRMEENYFDVIGRRGDSDCDRYADVQAESFCLSAVHGYIVYTEIFAKEGASPAAEQTYAAHADTVRNLIQYVDNFMTAPTRW